MEPKTVYVIEEKETGKLISGWNREAPFYLTRRGAKVALAFCGWRLKRGSKVTISRCILVDAGDAEEFEVGER